MDKVYLKITKEQVEQTLGYELEHFSLHPEYVKGECIGLEIEAVPKEKTIYLPINACIEKQR